MYVVTRENQNGGAGRILVGIRAETGEPVFRFAPCELDLHGLEGLAPISFRSFTDANTAAELINDAQATEEYFAHDLHSMEYDEEYAAGAYMTDAEWEALESYSEICQEMLI